MEQTLSCNRTKKVQFTDLPSEIRLKIWRAMLPRRQLNIREGRLEISARRQIQRGDLVFVGNRFASPGAALPVGLHINFESRQETLKHYVVLHRPVVHNGKILSYKGLFLINTDLDTVFMTQPALICCDKQFVRKFISGTFEYYGEENIKVRNAIKKIEIYVLKLNPRVTPHTDNIEELMRFQSLEEIVLVRHPHAVEDGDHSDDYYINVYRTAFEYFKTKNAPHYERRITPEVTVRLDTCVAEFEQPELDPDFAEEA